MPAFLLGFYSKDTISMFVYFYLGYQQGHGIH